MSSKNYFDQIAPQWDKTRESFFSELVREKALSVAGVQEGKIAADIGAGSGFISEGLIRRGLRVIAVDQSEAMLSEMKKKFADLEGIDYRLGKAENLPINDETVDYVFANMYLHHVKAPPNAIKEMVRTLKSGGKLVITDLDEHDYEFLRVEHHDRWMGFNRNDIRKWFTEVGLKHVSVDCVGENCCAQSSGGDKQASISIFVACGEK
ncbi:MAG: class I SAM-dependent methyltransferase [bacterium]